MASSEENSFEDNWRNAFNDVSETPPETVWKQIEERLDEEDDRVVIIPFWQQWQSLKWVAAAGVTVLLVSLAGWWLTENEPSSTLLTQQEVAETGTQKGVSKQSIEHDLVRSKTNKILRQGGKEIRQDDKEVRIAATILPTQKQIKKEGVRLNDEKPTLFPVNRQKTNFTRPSKKESIATNIIEKDGMLAKSTTLTDFPEFSISTSVLTLSLLESKKMHELVGLPKRQPWVAYQAVSSAQKVPKTPTKAYWTSLGVTPASYNAGISISKSQALALISQGALANTTQSGGSANQPLFSYLLQWQGGVQLAQRWSLETGINYLQGNSVFEGTNGFNVFTNSYVNNLEAAINASDNTGQRFSLAASSSDKSQIQSLTTSQNINTSYQFLQVPVQAGYALLRPKRKLSIWFLAGLINNIFLKNSFESGQKHTISVRSPDSPYRMLSFSGSTGLRIQYKMSKRWSSQLTGNYQLALGTTTKTDAAFEARPHLLGVGAGLRYGF